MSGIGNHKYSNERTHVYAEDVAICPYCGNKKCYADHVNVGVGLIQCGPYYCDECFASEISSYDTRELTEREKATGWYEPGTPVSETANTVGGELVDHKTAKVMYNAGLLDEK